MALWDDSKPGFVGDDNIYGVGIRVGYYTQAVSIWVANFYARHEAPYLHTLTILFLFALFIGVCQLSATPSNTYAIEPFMLTSIAYHTLYLGLYDPNPPYQLRWDVEFRKHVAVLAIWLAFSGFDTWYWWTGVWKMKPSNGPIGTVIFFPYVGNTPLFGPDEWISIAARTINAWVITVLTYCVVCLIGNTIQQREMDHSITPERLKSLASRWANVLSDDVRRPDTLPSAYTPATSKASSVIAGDEIKEPTQDTPRSPTSPQSGVDDDSKSTSMSRTNSESPPSYRQPTRTNTGLLRLSLLRTLSQKGPDLSVQPPDYVLYEPSFEQLNMAYDLLKATTACEKKKEPFPGAMHLRIFFYLPIWFADLFWYLCVQLRHPFRPAVLLAIEVHASTLMFACQMSYPKIMRLAVRHPLYRKVKRRDMVLASRIILSTEQVVKPSRNWQLAMGYAMLGACSVLVIGTELTIQWNKIEGVQNLSSVGQLIPFTLGVGSLLKIVWSAIAHRDKKAEQFCYYDRCSKTNTGSKEAWEEAGKRFLDCREAWQMRREIAVQDEQKAVARVNDGKP